MVVGAAVALADRSGIDGVTLPKVAAELGVTPMSLYRHVGSKGELLQLIQDAGLGPPPEPAVGTWRERLQSWAIDLYRAYLARPWIVRIPITGPPVGPNLVGWMEQALEYLAPIGLDWAQKIGVLTTLSGYVRQSATFAQELTGELDGPRYAVELRKIIAAQRLPQLTALVESGLFDQEASADGSDFRFGLDLVLNGVAGLIGAQEPDEEVDE